MGSALEDVTVVSFAQLAQGPVATQMLGDMGAEIIKIEPPGGEWGRNWSMGNSYPGGESAVWLSFNRNKKSVEADLKDEEEKQVIYDLVEEADVVVENFRPGVMERLGFGYEELSKQNPGLIYCSSSGWGSEGPYADRPGQDLILQGASGMMSITGRGGDPPTPVGPSVVDLYSSAYLAFSILSALYYREQTGRGQKIEGNLLNAAIALQSQELSVYTNGGVEPERSESGIAHVYNQAPFGVYETSDGYITLSLVPPAEVGEALGIDDIKDVTSWEEAYDRREEIKRTIEAVTRTKPTDELLDVLWGHDIWCGPINDYEDVVNHPQVEANEMLREIDHPTVGTLTVTGIPVELSETPGTIESSPPLLGEHTEEIFGRFGHSVEEIRDNE